LSEREEKIILHDRSGEGLAWYGRDSVHTAFISKWFYYVSRARLSFIKGSHETLEAQCTIIKAKSGDTQGYAEDWPIHYEITCYPEDLVALAKKILDVFS